MPFSANCKLATPTMRRSAANIRIKTPHGSASWSRTSRCSAAGHSSGRDEVQLPGIRLRVEEKRYRFPPDGAALGARKLRHVMIDLAR